MIGRESPAATEECLCPSKPPVHRPVYTPLTGRNCGRPRRRRSHSPDLRLDGELTAADLISAPTFALSESPGGSADGFSAPIRSARPEHRSPLHRHVDSLHRKDRGMFPGLNACCRPFGCRPPPLPRSRRASRSSSSATPTIAASLTMSPDRSVESGRDRVLALYSMRRHR